MDLGLRGKAAAVMAGSEGIGLACARALAREGADVAICARREDVLRSSAKALADETGAHVHPIVADLAQARDVERFVNAASADMRGLDVLVVNAGGPPAGYFEDITEEQWRTTYELTLMSTVRAVRAALPHFRAEGGGSVVAIQSTSVKNPIDNLVLSNAVRSAVIGLFKTLAGQYAKENVRFNVVLPGAIATERQTELSQHKADSEGVTLDEVLAKRARSIPLGRLGEPLEVGEVVAWLASERASYVTGTVLQVDGGMVKFPL